MSVSRRHPPCLPKASLLSRILRAGHEPAARRRQTSGCVPATSEPLERRRLLSVTVTEDYTGFFEINGDASSNDIEVTLSQNAGIFTIGGQAYGDGKLAFLTVNGNGGNDTVNLNSIDGRGNIGADVTTGDGNDSISANFDSSITAGAGDDTIRATDSYRGEIFGGAGDDQIIASGLTIDAVIDGGDGNNFIDCSACAAGVTVQAGNGNDTIYGSPYDDVISAGAGSDSLVGNGGNDEFDAQQGVADTIIGNGNNDTLYGNGSEASVVDVSTIIT